MGYLFYHTDRDSQIKLWEEYTPRDTQLPGRATISLYS